MDTVLTMAALIHLHPSSRSSLAEIARLAGRHLCVVEHESTANAYVFLRDYRRVFERLGLRHVRSAMLDVPEYEGYEARLFAR